MRKHSGERESGKNVLERVVTTLRRTLQWVREDYKPEKHYFRGPGPACKKRGRAHLVDSFR